MNLKFLFIIVLFISGLYANNEKSVTLQLSWLNQFQFAGYYVAKEKGFYKEAGLNVNIKEFTSGTDIQKVLDNSEADFVVGRTSFIIDKIAGKNLVALAAIYQHSPMMLLVRKDSNIKTVADLKSKNIMITGDAKNTAAILAMLSSQKIDLREVNIQPHSFNLDDLITGKTDAMASYISNEPIQLEDQSIPYNIIHPKDYGFDFYNGMLFTTSEMIKKNPDTVKAFHDATIKGWNYAFSNIQESSEIIFNQYNTQNKSLKNLIKEGTVLKTLAYDKDGKLGSITEERIKEIANVFLIMGFINQDYNLDGFIYKYNSVNKNKVYLTQEEKKWIKEHKTITYSGSNWSPLHTYTKKGGMEGMAVDILRTVSKELGINIIFEKKNDWSAVLSAVKNKELDFAIATGETSERKKYGLFTKTYLTFPLVIATRNNISYISKTSELNNKVVAVGKNYTAHEFLRDNYPKVKLLVVKDTEAALKAVANNQAFAMIDILPAVSHKISELNLSNLKITGKTEYDFELKSFVRKDYPQLVSLLNKGYENLNPQKKKEIISKWLSVKYVSEINYVFAVEIILFFTLLIIIIVYIQNVRLKRTNTKLSLTLTNLKETREDLIAAEKMATLGELVGGVTHELISPLSVGIMGSSYIVEETKEINRLYDEKELEEESFKEYIRHVNETSKSITLNLQRTKNIVNSFKNVAVDQAIEEKRDFNVKNYIDEILLSLDSKLKQTQHKVVVKCDKRIVIKSHPGYLAQILINLINNSLLHAFDLTSSGEITICVRELNDELELIYTDNGKGISKINQEKIFDEYFTTKKNQGGTGLGLSIIQSIVQNKFKGTIDFKSKIGEGIHFTIIIPLN